MRQAQLKPIDMTKFDNGQHPDIKEKTQYLVKRKGQFLLGNFRLLCGEWAFEQDWGPNVSAAETVDTAKTGRWQGIWEIVP